MQDYELINRIALDAWADRSAEGLTAREELMLLYGATPGQRAFCAVLLFIREVSNGGLQQFFWNSSGLYSEEVVLGLQLIGASDYVEVYKRALAFFPESEVPIDRTERQFLLCRHLLADRDEAAELNLDELFVALYRGKYEEYFEPLNRQLYDEQTLYPYFLNYLTSHPEDFFID